jgi:hypothetical protein
MGQQRRTWRRPRAPARSKTASGRLAKTPWSNNGQLVVTCGQVIVGAMLSWHPVDRTPVAPAARHLPPAAGRGRHPTAAADRARRFRLPQRGELRPRRRRWPAAARALGQRPRPAPPTCPATGLRDARLHDARHTAATVLLVLRQPTPTVMSLMGWSSESMAARYQHVTDALRSQVASQVGELTWDSPPGNDDQSALIVRRGSLAAILAAIEECIASHQGATDQSPDLLAALAELRSAMPPEPAVPGTANEPKLSPGGHQKDERQLPVRRRARSTAVEVGFEPTEGCPLTRFRGLRTTVHSRP